MKHSVGGFHSIKYSLDILKQVGIKRFMSYLLSKNTCKTCALGMGGQKGGMTNELGRFPEVCKKSLQAMKSDLNGAIKKEIYQKYSLEKLAALPARELENLGRIAHPLYCNENSTHLSPISWEEAIKKVAEKLKLTKPDKSFFYFSGRSSNEAGFLLQLFARLYGTNNVNNCSYYCHQASGVGLTDSLGSGTATLTLDDVEQTDLFILIGGNPSSNHPRLLTTLAHLKKKGKKVIVINPVVEPGLVNFKVPSLFESLFLGTNISDHYYTPHIGGDLALLSGVAKYLIEENKIAHSFIEKYTNDFEQFNKHITELSWELIIQQSGIAKKEIKELAKIIHSQKNVIFSWTMGITHHLNGTDNVQSIVNLALLTGNVGRPHCGLLPLRGHSNVQGMGTVGVTPKLKDEIFKKISEMGISLPQDEGLDTMACMQEAANGNIDFAWCLGGNLYESNPDTTFASQSMNKIGMITYLNTTLNKGHFFARGKETLILPVLARDEEAQRTTQESMFNFVRISDGGKQRIKNLKSEVAVISEIASQVLPNSPIDFKEMLNHQSIRDFMAKVIPGLQELKEVEKKRKEFTIPKRVFHHYVFNTHNTKANFRVLNLPILDRSNDSLTLMSVRSEGQFNSIIYDEEDAFRGIDHRQVILMNKESMQIHQLKENQRISVQSKTGIVRNLEVREFNIKTGNALMYYPESNPLISRDVDPRSKTPSFKSTQIRII